MGSGKGFPKKENGGENESIPMGKAVQTTTKTPALSVRTNAAHEKTTSAITQQVALQAIEKLADLKTKGLLTEEEFLQKKRELLDVI